LPALPSLVEAGRSGLASLRVGEAGQKHISKIKYYFCLQVILHGGNKYFSQILRLPNRPASGAENRRAGEPVFAKGFDEAGR